MRAEEKKIEEVLCYMSKEADIIVAEKRGGGSGGGESGKDSTRSD